jgi:hypothetical protein
MASVVSASKGIGDRLKNGKSNFRNDYTGNGQNIGRMKHLARRLNQLALKRRIATETLKIVSPNKRNRRKIEQKAPKEAKKGV